MFSSAASKELPGGEKSGDASTPVRTPTGATRADEGQNLPLVDPLVLQVLEDQLGRADLATNFAEDYAALWEQREHRLTASLADQDRDAALDVALSLKVTSTMVGALRLARLAQTLESAVRAGDLSRGDAVLALISTHGRATVDELRMQYLQHRGPALSPRA